MNNLDLHIESLIFTSAEPISVKEIIAVLTETSSEDIVKEEVKEAIIRLIDKYNQDHYSIMIKEISEGLSFMTKPDYHDTVGEYLKQTSNKRLSTAAMETLAIIAYKQDVSKSEVEQIRGVNCDYTIQKLLEKELVVIKGRADTPGRPLLYGTSAKFMDYFGLKSLKDLPKLTDFEQEENKVGDQAPITETIAAPGTASEDTSEEV